jgi:hypothetical protein
MNPEELELAYYRRIMIAMVTQAVDDLTNDRQPATDRTRMMLEQNHESALTFVRSRAFDVICDAIDLPACRVRRRCLA